MTGPAYVPDDRLPAFAQPPVTEAIVGVEFAPLEDLGVVTIVDLYRRWSADYPRPEERAALPPSFGPGGEPVELLSINTAIPLRLLMKTADETRLLSLQADRLFHNWRAANSGTEYPRYTLMREEFACRWNEFLSFVDDQQIGEIVPTYIEVSFVNHYPVDISDGDFGMTYIRDVPPEMPGNSVVFRSQLVRSVEVDDTGSGWMTIISGPASEPPSGSLQQLSVSTRLSTHIGPSLDAILPALDRVHDISVRGFAAATTSAQHEIWGRSL